MRLIDADKLLIEFMNSDLDHLQRDDWKEVIQIVQDAPDTPPQWIPIMEKIPEPEKRVLLCDIDGDIYLGHLTRYGEYYPDLGDDRIKNVIAWMPRPRPYREVDE